MSRRAAPRCAMREPKANLIATRATSFSRTPSSQFTQVSRRSIPPKRGARWTRRPETHLGRGECCSLDQGRADGTAEGRNESLWGYPCGIPEVQTGRAPLESSSSSSPVFHGGPGCPNASPEVIPGPAITSHISAPAPRGLEVTTGSREVDGHPKLCSHLRSLVKVDQVIKWG